MNKKGGRRNVTRSSSTQNELPQEMPLQSLHPHSPTQRQPHLPVEILVLIFTHVTRTSDLLRVVRCSRTFRAVAEPLLYAHVNVKATPCRAYLLNKTLRHRVDLVGSIRKLALDARASMDLNPPDLEINNNDAPSSSLHLRFSGLQAPVLSDARNLQSLDISFNPQPRVDPFHHQRSQSDPSIIAGHVAEPTISLSQLISSHTRLTKLTIHFHLSPFFLHELVRSVLRSQPNLKHLELWNVSFLPGLLETDVPNLEAVVSGYPVAAQLTPTRPITTLAVHADQGQDTRALDFMPTWLQSPPPKAPDAMDHDFDQEHHLEDLFLKVQVTSPAQISLIQTISDRAPDLVKLKLAVTFVAASTFVSDSGWNMHLFNMFIGMIPNFLSKFRTLQVLDLCGSRGFVCRPTMMYNLGFNYSTGDPDLDAERSRVTGWSIHCPTLREVVLPNGHRWTMDKAVGESFWTMVGGDHISERDEMDEDVQSRRFSKDLPWTS